MQPQEKKRARIGDTVSLILIIFSCVGMAVFSLVPIAYSPNARLNGLLKATVPLLFGCVLALVTVRRLRLRLFGNLQKWLFLLPCILIAVNNFPFASYFTGNSKLLEPTAVEALVFALYCVSVGVFEECVFRGIVFLLLAERLPQNKKGLILTFVISSVIFGLSHLLNLFAGAGIVPTLRQVAYSTLIGGLCAFALIKTKNLIACMLIHALYDFCGLLLDGNVGLGGGVVFTLPDVLLMAIVGIAVGVFVLVCVFRSPEEDRRELYDRLGIKRAQNDEKSGDVSQ